VLPEAESLRYLAPAGKGETGPVGLPGPPAPPNPRFAKFFRGHGLTVRIYFSWSEGRRPSGRAGQIDATGLSEKTAILSKKHLTGGSIDDKKLCSQRIGR
jgi:hypothetical protein